MASQALNGCLPEGYGFLSVGPRQMVSAPVTADHHRA